MKTIGIYMPKWLYRSDKSDRMFLDELISTIGKSGKYRVLRIDLQKLNLQTDDDAERFCAKHNLAFIVQYDSHFFSDSKIYKKNLALLEKHVPFVNSMASHAIGHNKIFTKRLLREKGVPVLDDTIATSHSELLAAVKENEWYVVKPPDRGAGEGVRLIQRSGRGFLDYYDKAWRRVIVTETSGNVQCDPYRIDRSGNDRQ